MHRRATTRLAKSKRSRFLCSIVLGALATIALWFQTASAQQAVAFQIVVHPQNPLASVSREFLSDALLKKVTRWDDGETLRPVDLPATSPTRQKVSEFVHKRSVAAIRSYWQQRIFSGRGVPPPELESDDAVLSYVLKNRGAVGYVSGSVKPGDAKVIALR
jgi:ABC-type phosphate transport system substrate-binding protein